MLPRPGPGLSKKFRGTSFTLYQNEMMSGPIYIFISFQVSENLRLILSKKSRYVLKMFQLRSRKKYENSWRKIYKNSRAGIGAFWPGKTLEKPVSLPFLRPGSRSIADRNINEVQYGLRLLEIS